jgi:hypothetical protein
MLRLDRFFINLFDDDDISLDELSAYTTDHLGRMIANNPGALLNTRINATTLAFTALENCANDDGVKLGLRKARVMLKDQFRRSLPEQLGYIQGAIKSFFKAQSPEVLLECFPEGLTVFSQCRDDAVNNHLTELVTALTARSAPTGPMPANALGDAGGLLSTWIAIYSASETSSAHKSSTEVEKRAARKALQLELFLNLLFLAAQFPNQPEKAADFMRQSLLQNPDTPPPPENTPPPLQ